MFITSGDMNLIAYIGIIVLLALFIFYPKGYEKVKRVVYSVLFFASLLFTYIVHVSDEFLYWLYPNMVSLLDYRWGLQFQALLLNYFLILFLLKLKVNKYILITLAVINTMLWIYY
jgi:hypothetical protein